VVRPNLQLLGHVRHHIGLADGLAAGDRQRMVGIGGIEQVGIDEMLARNFVHGPQHRLLGDAAPAQVEQKLHAADALVSGRQIGHRALS
jgi:hypothetical protein